jgi:hypothetical protein
MNCPKSVKKIDSIGEVFARIESVISAFLTDKRVFVNKDDSKSGIISNVNLPRASPITRHYP